MNYDIRNKTDPASPVKAFLEPETRSAPDQAALLCDDCGACVEAEKTSGYMAQAAIS